MAAQFFVPGGDFPLSGVMINATVDAEYFIPGLGMFNDNQGDVAIAGSPNLIMAPYKPT